MRGGALWEVRESRSEPIAAMFGRLLDRQDAVVLVGTIDEVVVGYATLEFETLRDGGVLAVIGDLYVEPEARAVGVGEALATDLVDRADAAGLHRYRRIRAARSPLRRRTSSNGPGSPPARSSCTSGCRSPTAAPTVMTPPADRSKSRSARSWWTAIDCCWFGGGGARRSGSGRHRAAGSSSVSDCTTPSSREVLEETGISVTVDALAGWAERTGDATGSVPLRDPRLLRHAERFDHARAR